MSELLVQVRAKPFGDWREPTVSAVQPTPLLRARYLCEKWPYCYEMRVMREVQPEEDDKPYAYLLKKAVMVTAVLEEARDALTALSVAQLKLHNISPTLAQRMDDAGMYSTEMWMKERP